MNVDTHSLDAFNAEAIRFVRELSPGARATVVALSGDLGAGKTTFVQAIAKELGIEEPVNSPTFVIEKVYSIQGSTLNAFKCLVHIDAYRLNSAQEISVLGWPQLVADPGNLIFVEWPEHVSGAVPHDAIRIVLSGTGDERTILYGEK